MEEANFRITKDVMAIRKFIFETFFLQVLISFFIHLATETMTMNGTIMMEMMP